MIRGRLERLYSAGFVEGWAHDVSAPQRLQRVEMRSTDGEVLGGGLAFLFRDDLADQEIGFGWCGFRLRLMRPPEAVRSGLVLLDPTSGTRIDAAKLAPVAQEAEQPGEFDPFAATSMAPLRACAAIFDQYLRNVGPQAFVRTAHRYVLGRRAEPETIALDSILLESGAMSPLQLLERLAESVEFKLEPRPIPGPWASDFPFFGAAQC